MIPKLGLRSIPASLFSFLDRGNYSRGGKTGSLSQARVRLAHPFEGQGHGPSFTAAYTPTFVGNCLYR